LEKILMKARLMFIAAALACGAASAQPAADRGGVLADKEGKTLYIFTKDTAGVSNCYDGCAKAWPPFAATAAAKNDGDFTVISRKDGSKQWAHGGQPLYYFAGDAAAGEKNGEGSGGVWFVVKPKAKAPAKNVSSYDGGYGTNKY
jgi:predicted lipoprotein with Yx(FWY)xxD motif